MKALALGTKLFVEDPETPGEFIQVRNLTAVPVPSPDKPEIDVTDLDSTGKEFLPGLPDAGELALSGFFNPEDPGQTLMMDDANDPDAPVRTFRVDFTRQGTRFTFSAFVKRFAPEAGGPEEAATVDGALRVTGAVVRSAIVAP